LLSWTVLTLLFLCSSCIIRYFNFDFGFGFGFCFDFGLLGKEGSSVLYLSNLLNNLQSTSSKFCLSLVLSWLFANNFKNVFFVPSNPLFISKW
jgi:hypothetical protein